jgi:hypothetical protein
MTKTDECNRCENFSGHYGPEFLVCAIHPTGPAQDPCPDFAGATEQYEPLGAYYAGRMIVQPTHFLTTAERLEILDTHPFFTRICPTCGAGLAEDGQMHCVAVGGGRSLSLEGVLLGAGRTKRRLPLGHLRGAVAISILHSANQ